MTDRKIMYVCEHCADHNAEGCGHYDPADIRVMPDGTWLCEDCADDFDTLEGCGVQLLGTEDDAEWPVFSSFPNPPEYTAETKDQ